MIAYLSLHPVHISAVTVLERTRGYSLLWRRSEGHDQIRIESARVAYLSTLGKVWPNRRSRGCGHW